ncbi:MAG TPA: cobalamin-binding protein [Nitrososphaerales archaeon]|nr:cobalamin-binding protein [Nitrososphaerales archaeon]
MAKLSLYPPSHFEHQPPGKRANELEKGSAERIITTLPSATEIVALLGLGEKLVGITHECDYPPEVRSKPVVMWSVFDSSQMTSRAIDDAVLERVTKGESVYKIDEQLLRSLQPDLIITQELCEVCATPLREVAKAIANLNPKPRILSLTPHNLKEVLGDVLRVGKATGRFDKARELASGLNARVARVRERCSGSRIERPSVFCLEWLDPVYCSGHWMPELVDYAGGKEMLGSWGEPSTVVEWESVVKVDPEVIFVTVCGYDVRRTLSEISTLTRKPGWTKLQAVRNGRVFILDSPAYYSRSGSRLVDGVEIMAYLLHPELFPEYRPPNLAAYSLSENRFIQ